MTCFTKKDLSIMQAWSLQRKIQVTQAKIIEWYFRYDGKVAVSYSAGKDSTVLLDLARRAFPEISAIFVDTGLEYPELREFALSTPNVTRLTPDIPFNKVIEKFGYPVISKDVAKRIYYARRGSEWAVRHLQGLNRDGTPSKFNQRYVKWAHLVDAPFLISDKCCSVMKEQPMRRYTKQTGLMPIVGTLASESFRRQSAYLKSGCNAYFNKEPKSQPLAFWTEQDILQYLRITGIPYASIYGDIAENENGKLKTTGVSRSGCMWCAFGVHLEKNPNRFQRMKLTHPDIYEYCITKMGCGKVLDYINVPYE